MSAAFLVSTPPSPLLTKKAVVSSKDEDVSVFIYFVHFVLCDVTLQFYLLEEVVTPLSPWSRFCPLTMLLVLKTILLLL